jgi:chromosome condensin MukBEF complex kleisin-like MukF subunit
MCDHNEPSQATSSDWETVCADCGEVMSDTLATIRNLQARITYAQHDGNHAEVLRLKKELEKSK